MWFLSGTHPTLYLKETGGLSIDIIGSDILYRMLISSLVLGTLLVERQGSQQGSYISSFSHSCSILAGLRSAFFGSSLVGPLMHKSQSLGVFLNIGFSSGD